MFLIIPHHTTSSATLPSYLTFHPGYYPTIHDIIPPFPIYLAIRCMIHLTFSSVMFPVQLSSSSSSSLPT